MTEHANILESIFGTVGEIPEPTEADEESIIESLQRAVDLQVNTEERPGRTLSHTEKMEMLKVLEEYERRKEYRGHLAWFPDEGPLKWQNYPKHIEFMKLGIDKRERMFMAGNRVGKSIAGGYEMTCHLTGMYPHWWEGKRFVEATDCWAAGDTGQTTRDIVQSTLMGDNNDWGTGLIPQELIQEIRMRPGGGGAVDLVRVKHTSGKLSKIGFKSYDQKRRAFQGTAKHAIWLDEEPPLEVYGECLMRTMTTGGVVMVTFTPLQGITPFVQEFLDAARESGELGY